MKETIAALVSIQGVDDEIQNYRVQRDELASNLDGLKVILTGMSSELDDKREKLAEANRFYSTQQEELRADGDRMAQAKQKLAAVTRTKEYAAMQRELDNLRRKYTDDEAELKRLAAAIEEYKLAIANQETKLNELQSEVAQEEANSAARLNELDSQMATINVRREEMKVKLDPQLLRRYERILPKRGGRAVVPALGGKCTGCQMRLPPQLFILVQRGEQLQQCPACQRFLFFEQATGVPADA